MSVLENLFWWICVIYQSHVLIVHIHGNFSLFDQFYSFYWGIFESAWVVVYKLLSVETLLWVELILWLRMVVQNGLFYGTVMIWEHFLWVLALTSPTCFSVINVQHTSTSSVSGWNFLFLRHQRYSAEHATTNIGLF